LHNLQIKNVGLSPPSGVQLPPLNGSRGTQQLLSFAVFICSSGQE